MAQIHTHYDNLKVARNAPPEVIRAAYKALSQRFHPDRNPGNPEAARIMAILNTSYEILSDPDKRRGHDLWIEQQEKETPQTTTNSQSHQTPQEPPTPQQPVPRASPSRIVAHVLRNWLLYGMAVIFVWIWATDKPSTPPASPKPYRANPHPPMKEPPLKAPDFIPMKEPPLVIPGAEKTVVRPAYLRPTAAPNGNPWPTSAGYVKGYQRLHAGGLSKVTVDNSRNDSDVFVKLVSLDGANAYPVRQFYIPAFGNFTLNKVTAGSYDIRYRDLSNGGLSRSEAFSLEEVTTNNGTQYSSITMTLYKVRNGNMQTYSLSEAEF